MRRRAERRGVVLVAASASLVGVFVWCQLNHDPSNAISLLYILPISLVALEFGLAAGIAAAGAAIGLVGVWWWIAEADLGAIGVLTRGVAFLAVALFSGLFSDRMRQVQRRQQSLVESGLALANLARAGDLAVILGQHAGEVLEGIGVRAELDGQEPVESGRLGRVRDAFPIEVRGVRYGTLVVGGAIALDAQERATLDLLALQAAVAAESLRMLEQERDRALLGAELRETRTRLEERSQQMRELVDRHEAERHDVAEHLHEESAQTMAAVLLGLRALENELDSEPSGPRVGAMSTTVDETMRSLRSLAMRLRPPVLQLGLEPALGALAEERAVQMIADLGEPGLPSEVETTVYRVVEEALNAIEAPRSVDVRSAPGRARIVVEVRAACPIDPARLTVLRARLELVGGTLTTTDAVLHALIPLRSEGPGPPPPEQPLDDLIGR